MEITSKLFVRTTRESFDTSVSDTTKVIIDYYDLFNIDIRDLYNDFMEFLDDMSNQTANV